MRIKNRKAQEASMITWIVATFILLFLLVLYLGFVLAWYSNKGGAEINLQSSEYGFGIISNSNLANVLNSITKVQQYKGFKIYVALLKSLDIYLDNPVAMGGLDDNINILYSSSGSLRISREISVDNEKVEAELKKELEDYFDKTCSKYIFTSPNIKIDKRDSKAKEEVQEEMLAFSQELTIKLPYKNQIVEIKYQQLKEC